MADEQGLPGYGEASVEGLRLKPGYGYGEEFYLPCEDLAKIMNRPFRLC